jgi:hypothetical protein
MELHISLEPDRAYINGKPITLHSQYPDWEAVLRAVEHAAQSKERTLILCGSIPALQEMQTYLQRVGWIRERAFSRGANDAYYDYSHAYAVFGEKRMDPEWQGILLAIWRLLIMHFNGRWEVRCA